MTVYSVMEISNDGGYLMGIYSTREKAEAAAIRLGLDPNFPRCIMEYELDSVPWTDKPDIS